MRHGVTVKANGGVILVNLTVKKIAEPESLQGLFLVTFETVRADKPVAQEGRTGASGCTGEER